MNKAALTYAAIGVLLLSTESALAFKFGDDWDVVGGPRCKVTKTVNGKTTTIKTPLFKHTGVDISATKGHEVTVNAQLYHYNSYLDTNGWRYHVIACTAVESGKCKTDKDTAYYDFLHLEANPKLVPGQSLKGVVIGTIADLSKKGAGSHLHLARRNGPFDLSTTMRGALPPSECNDVPSRLGRPPFQENFVPPDQSVVSISKKK